MVNPDHFVANTSTGEIVERRLGDKRVAIVAGSGGLESGAGWAGVALSLVAWVGLASPQRDQLLRTRSIRHN